eukprot:Clim_evm18s246 gene=Clim_evmTU18s246
MPEEAKVEVPSKDPEPKDKDTKYKGKEPNKGKDEEPELSEEDQKLKDELEMCVERLTESDASLYKSALQTIKSLIRESTITMTSVPKPLKFLRPHYDTLVQVYEKIMDEDDKNAAAEVVSVVAMTKAEGRDCLKYCQLSGYRDITAWGHEYVRHLSNEVINEYRERVINNAEVDDLVAFAKTVVPYHMSHNAETEASDLLMEIERLDLLSDFVDEAAHQGVCLYLVSCVPYVSEPEDGILLKTALGIYRKFGKTCDAMRMAIRLADLDICREILEGEKDEAVKKQLCFMLGRHQMYLDELDEDLMDIISNSKLTENFLALARELDIMEPKLPEDIYKTNLEGNRTGFSGSNIEPARANLAKSFVNGFVNAGFCKDKIMTVDEEGKGGQRWIYKNKDIGMLCATASLGCILLWDVDGGLTEIDKYLYVNDENVKAGALLACGMINAGVNNDCDPALALLADFVTSGSEKAIIRVGAIFGLGLAYAGSGRTDLFELLSPVLEEQVTLEIQAITALALGLVFVGKCNGDVTEVILNAMTELGEKDVHAPMAKLMALGLALNFLGKQEQAETAMMALEALPEALKMTAIVLTEICAYAGTGNVLKIQKMLHTCSEHIELGGSGGHSEDGDEKSDEAAKKEGPVNDDHQSIATLGIGLIAMGEEIGLDMALRAFNHLLQYGEPSIRKAVPLAMALLCASNPKLNVLDTLSKLSHEHDSEVSHNAIVAMGMVGAGTNNSRVATLLRQLALFYAKDKDNLFAVRLAQGLLHMGKGTMSISPYHTDRQLLSPVALAGLLVPIVSCLESKDLILGSKATYLMYAIVLSMYPRLLVTVDKDLKPVQVTVRVGQAVDVVGQAGKPKSITGFQTHTTPVLLSYGERAELGTDDWKAINPILEGFVILEKVEE